MNKTAIIGGVVVLLIIVAVGAYVLVGSKGAASYSSTTAASTALSTVQGYTTTQASTSPTTAASTTVNATKASYTINLESSAQFGEYLANSTGFTLYTYDNDVANSNASNCYSSCAANWPPFYTANISVPAGLNASAFGTITRTGGSKQLTYKGYPLYLFAGDSKAGDVSGNGVAGFAVATK